LHNNIASSFGEVQPWFMMDKFLASAPARVFLSGEAAFEFGAKTLALPVEVAGKRNSVAFTFQESPGKFIAYSGQQFATIVPNGRVRGDDGLRPYLEAAKAALVAAKIQLESTDTSFSISLESNSLQSMGLSTSLCSAVFSGMFSYYGEQDDAKPAFSKAFSTAGADSVTDADVALMVSDSGLIVERSFLLDGTVKLTSKSANLGLPEGTLLLYAEPADAKSRQAEISQALSSFCGVTRASGKPKATSQMTADERAKAGSAFGSLSLKLSKELASESPSPEKTAIYLECEHEMLSSAGAVPKPCQDAVTAAKKAGALAAKASGFYGGALALCHEDAVDAVADAFGALSFVVCGPLTVSKKGMTCARV